MADSDLGAVTAPRPVAAAVDAHQHFFFPERFPYPWMTGGAEGLRRPLGPDELRAAMQGTAVERCITVQAVHDVAETEHLLGIAAATPEVVGVVGWVDLENDGVVDRLAALKARPDGGFLVGVRHIVHDEVDAEWLGRPAVRRGLRAVGDAELCYDLLVRTRELPSAIAAAEALPGVSFVLDHIAKPPIGREDVNLWRERLAPLARMPHVAVKFSGLVTETAGPGWSAADFVPYAAGVLGMFGPDRVLFGSDWPVCTLVAGYSDVYEAAHDALEAAGADGADLTQVFGATAARVYGLAPTDNAAPPPRS